MIGPQLPPGWKHPGLLDAGQQEDEPSQQTSKVALSDISQFPTQSSLSCAGKFQIGCGLNNLGNSCYMNSVLQCLAYTPALLTAAKAQTLHGFRGKCPLKLKCQPCTVCMLEGLIQEMTRRHPGTAISPSQITQNLTCFSKVFTRGRQEDAHEFLLAVLDAVERDSKRALHIKGHDKLLKTMIEQLFCGRFVSCVECLECGHVSKTFETCSTLSLDLFRVQSVEQSWDMFTAVELLDGANKYKCDKCNKLVKARKYVDMDDESNVLVVHLKRFNGLTFNGKISRHIQFKQFLSLPSRWDSLHHKQQQQQTPAHKATHMLTGVVVHSGSSVHSGHYYALVRDAAGKWHEANDCSVTGATWQDVEKEQAYLLFYSRIHLKLPAATPSLGAQEELAVPQQAPPPVANGHDSGAQQQDELHGAVDPAPPPGHANGHAGQKQQTHDAREHADHSANGVVNGVAKLGPGSTTVPRTPGSLGFNINGTFKSKTATFVGSGKPSIVLPPKASAEAAPQKHTVPSAQGTDNLKAAQHVREDQRERVDLETAKRREDQHRGLDGAHGQGRHRDLDHYRAHDTQHAEQHGRGHVTGDHHSHEDRERGRDDNHHTRDRYAHDKERERDRDNKHVHDRERDRDRDDRAYKDRHRDRYRNRSEDRDRNRSVDRHHHSDRHRDHETKYDGEDHRHAKPSQHAHENGVIRTTHDTGTGYDHSRHDDSVHISRTHGTAGDRTDGHAHGKKRGRDDGQVHRSQTVHTGDGGTTQHARSTAQMISCKYAETVADDLKPVVINSMQLILEACRKDADLVEQLRRIVREDQGAGVAFADLQRGSDKKAVMQAMQTFVKSNPELLDVTKTSLAEHVRTHLHL